MKTIIICQWLGLVWLLNQTKASPIADEAIKHFMACSKDGSLTTSDIKRVMDNELHHSKYNETPDKFKCFVLCFYKKMNIIDAEGQHKPQQIIEFLEYKYADKKHKIKSAMEKCANIKLINTCDTAYDYEGCITENIANKERR